MRLKAIIELARDGQVRKALVGICRYQKGVLFLVIFTILFALMLLFSSGNSNPSFVESRVPAQQEASVNMVGVKEAVDPRDSWTNKVQEKVEQTAGSLEQKLAEQDSKTQGIIQGLQQELEQMQTELARQQLSLEAKELENSVRSVSTFDNVDTQVVASPAKTLGSFSRKYNSTKKNTKEYVTTGSFARAVLLTGVVVGTGSDTQSNPEPVMLRLTDAGMFSKGLRTEQIKEAILIGDCSGDLSSERAKCRLQTLSLENYRGEIVEKPVQGWIVGEDGRNGIKGRVIDKSSDLMRMAMLNGVLGGMSNFFQTQATAGALPLSAITGQQNSLSSMATLKAGAAGGAGDAFSKMADFLMERFNAMTPQIVIASGREVDVVFKHGVNLRMTEQEASSSGQQVMSGNLQNTSGVNGVISHSPNLNSHSNANANLHPNAASSSGYEGYGQNAFDEAISNMNNDMAGRGF